MGITHPGSGGREMSYFPWLMSCRLFCAKSHSVVGQRKMSHAATGKENMSRVSSRLF